MAIWKNFWFEDETIRLVFLTENMYSEIEDIHIIVKSEYKNTKIYSNKYKLLKYANKV